MAKKYRLEDVAQLKGKGIFFDANILIYLFWPTGQYDYENEYASIFKKLLQQKNNLYIDFLVMSEVINCVARTEYKKQASKQKFKEFKYSEDGKKVFNDIYIIVKDTILEQFGVILKQFDKQEIVSYLVVDELDFVDKAIVKHCKENNLILLTNDKDFKNADIDMLTSDSNIFN